MGQFTISGCFLRRLAYFYIGLPFFIFILTWLQWYISAPVILVFLLSFYFSDKLYVVHKKAVIESIPLKANLLIAFLIIIVYIYFSGIGSFSFQNEDHHYRNAIFQDLVRKPWPVMYQINGFSNDNPLEGKQSLLVYYMGYWLPAAILGKLFGLAFGRFFLFLWTVLGVWLVFCFLCQYFKKYSIKVLWLFIGWGTLYFLGTFYSFRLKDVFLGNAYLWAGNLLFADGNTGLIYWTFNQTIVPWLIILLIINQFKAKSALFITSLMFFAGPFSFIGFLPFIVYFIIKNDFQDLAKFQDIGSKISNYFTFQNTVGAVNVLLVSYIYFSANSSGNVFNFVMPQLATYFLFLLLSVGIIMVLIFSQNRTNPLYYLIALVLVLLPFFQLGFGLDFTARASIPAMFLLMLLVGDYLIFSPTSIKKYAVYLYLLVACLGHNLQVVRSVYFTGLQVFSNTILGSTLASNNNAVIKNIGDRMLVNKGKNITIKNNLDSLNNPNNVLVRNFMGLTDESFFYKYMAKKP